MRFLIFDHLYPNNSPWGLGYVGGLTLVAFRVFYVIVKAFPTYLFCPDRSYVYSARRTYTHARTYARTHAGTYSQTHHHLTSSLGSRSVPWLGEGLSMPSPSQPVLCCPLLQYLSRSSLHRLAGLPCRLFLSYGLQLVTREVCAMCVCICVYAHACMLTHMHTLHILALNFHLTEEISPFAKTFTNQSPTMHCSDSAAGHYNMAIHECFMVRSFSRSAV